MQRSTTVSGPRAWWFAVRPKTLSLSVSPVLVGSSLAWAEQLWLRWDLAMATLLAAVLIQIGTNLHNDAADHERGTDTPERVGPPRATAEGWLTATQVRRGALIAFGGALLLGILLALRGGWPIVFLGLSAVGAGYAYTGGPRPIAYSATGELFVFLYFGLLAVWGSYYLQTLSSAWPALVAGAALGLLAAAVLLVNNYRDLEGDRRARKFTLCHWLGRARSRVLFGVLLLLPVPLGCWALLPWDRAWLPLLALPPALWLLRLFLREPPGRGLNRLLAATAQLQLLLALLLSTGFLF
jgi:1,4-dihydroxy-2-naphthoate octaprenyltransferase